MSKSYYSNGTSPSDYRHIGEPVSRYDGVAKVTGAARYAADYAQDGMAHAYIVTSDIAAGRILELMTAEAMEITGVLAVFSHLNCPEVALSDKAYKTEISPPGSPFRPFQSDEILFSGQPIALVVAQDFETARYAASLIRAKYKSEPNRNDLQAERGAAFEQHKKRPEAMPPPKIRGDFNEAYQQSKIRFSGEYHTPAEHHNPMEMHATTVIWKSDDELLVHDKTQGAHSSQGYICRVFGYEPDKVVVDSPYIGGAFGSGLMPQFPLFLTVLASRALKQSVQLMITREQMFSIGSRPETIQSVTLGCDEEGKLLGLRHEAIGVTSLFEDFKEKVVVWGEQLYTSKSSDFLHQLVQLNVPTPQSMRAPGGALGLYALESAMDELAHEIGIDPIELRLKNYSDHDQQSGHAYSTKKLRDCYQQGAPRFGWDRRLAKPRAHLRGKELKGFGVATGIWEAMIFPVKAEAVLLPDGRVEISSGMADIGTGTYTIVSQIAAETLHLDLSQIIVQLSSSRFPKSFVEGGSAGAASVGTAVQLACEDLSRKIIHILRTRNEGPLSGAREDEILFQNGKAFLKEDEAKRISLAEIARLDAEPIKGEGSSDPGLLDKAKSALGLERYSSFVHSATFAEVSVDVDFGTIRVDRLCLAIDAGRIINPKTARSQIIGGAIWGLGMALQEESLTDPNFGRVMNHSFGEYHIPVNADIHAVDVLFIEEPDTYLNRLGIKGVGEIGTVGTAAAIANAVFNATGKRIRDLPITLDKLLH